MREDDLGEELRVGQRALLRERHIVPPAHHLTGHVLVARQAQGLSLRPQFGDVAQVHSRRYLSIRFDLRNCNAMCGGCNRRYNRDQRLYENCMLKMYGPEVIAELDDLRTRFQKVTDEELMEVLDQYRTAA